MKLGNVKKIALLMGVAGALYSPMGAFAAEKPADQPAKENIKVTATVKDDAPSAEEMRQKISDLEQQLAKEQESRERFSQILERLERLELKQASAAPYPAATSKNAKHKFLMTGLIMPLLRMQKTINVFCFQSFLLWFRASCQCRTAWLYVRSSRLPWLSCDLLQRHLRSRL